MDEYRSAVPRRPAGLTGRSLAWLALGYAALIVYGSLFPFALQEGARVSPAALFAAIGQARYSKPDVLTNLLAYMPLGLLLVFAARRATVSPPAAVVLSFIGGSLLSLSMELVQQLMPSRVASLLDLGLNAGGTLAGALIGTVLSGSGWAGELWRRWRTRWFRPGPQCDVALIALGLWALSQWTPLVPSFDLGNLRHGISPLWRTLQDPERFSVLQATAYALSVGGLALLFRTASNPGAPVRAVFFTFVALVLLYKIPVMSRQLSLEALSGATVGALVGLLPARLPMRASAWTAAGLLAGSFGLAQTDAVVGGRFYEFNWIPFTGQLASPLTGIASILEVVWFAAALAYLVRIAAPKGLHRIALWLGGFLLVTAAFVLEWRQQWLPGRYGDITSVLLALGAWILSWRSSGPLPPRQTLTSTGLRTWLAAAFVGLATAATAAALMGPRREARVDQSKLPVLPAPEALPAVPIQFTALRPRLPHPKPEELSVLKRLNPAWWREAERNAGGGHGELEAAALQALAQPGSIDLVLLHRRLMALQFQWRGHGEVKPLAIAYDWLHAHWSEEQRAALRAKLVQGCQYLVDFIRKERLSPYNVILYNAPFQALMACSIALYREDPRGEAFMAFTHDLWKNRVLPVWRQIMGRNGGWHEGGEYVGIGIGQAIYQLPAMWRRATGEDLFAQEPGIRGFLDFLVYRTQPDGMHFRWGDGSWFDRRVWDALPLALEYRHAAAYTLQGPPKLPTPTGWPWGPLTDASLVDPGAAARLPLVRHFDGLGLLVARSDWSPNATYVTFKAGDNYWSHVHLDQGAFTLYKGGPLAIDSGLYGPEYGSDHHMNYAYQTVAHNSVTVTDPSDKVPAPGKEKLRPIANDGGQRRIGSGWGVEAAPLDRAEWEAKRDIYHTGRLEQVLHADGLAVAVADVTPAYTNSRSGQGTFSHRTRRVERFWRVFGYDQVDDAVVVFDQVAATEAQFRKRWLLHTLQAPRVSADGFSVTVPPADRPGRSGGRLEGKVLLPRQAVIHPVGGPGLEFFVDDRNYDEDGKLQALIKRAGPANGEPGAWRIEISAAADSEEDVFLIVMLPAALHEKPAHRIRLLDSEGRIGAEIAGPKRTTRWWFRRGANAVEIEVTAQGDTRRHRVAGLSLPPPVKPGWIARVLGTR